VRIRRVLRVRDGSAKASAVTWLGVSQPGYVPRYLYAEARLWDSTLGRKSTVEAAYDIQGLQEP